VIVYGMNISADGYAMDAEGRFDWSEPAEDVFSFWTDHVRGTALDVCGRRMWETMRYWQTPDPAWSEAEVEFARCWQETPRLVVSRTLRVIAEGARLVRSPSEIPPVDGQVSVTGPALAASMLDMIDEFHAVVYPVTVGGGTPFFPAGARLDLELVETRRFDSGPVLMRYRRRG
jgi:dihydrofolate reductase